MNTVNQNILPRTLGFSPTINIRRFSSRQTADAVANLLLKECPSSLIPIGISCHTSDAGNVDFISLANTTSAFLISFDEKWPQKNKDFKALLSSGGNTHVMDKWRCYLVGFSMARIAVQVSRATNERVQGVDLSTLDTTNTWAPNSPPEVVVKNISASVDRWKISSLWLGNGASAQTDACLQAWLAACVASRCQDRLENAFSLRVDTSFINVSERDCLGLMIAQADLLDGSKSKEMTTDFSKISTNKFGHVEIVNSRYKTRVRRSNQTQIIMTDANGNDFVGHSRGAKGKTTTIEMRERPDIVGSQFKNVRVVGRQEPTNSEKAREELIHLILTGQRDLRQSPFIRAIWFPQWKATTRELQLAHLSVAEYVTTSMKLNESRRNVVRAMVGSLPMIIAHGPPGTGKTTTISAASRIWCDHKFPLWIVAHSNVAVKNIAESLSKQDVNYKLLVSKEFYEEWHEHLYAGVQECLIRSDELPHDIQEMEKIMGGSCIVLCTLSMLSNPMLQENGTFKIVPMERLIIDEASQINNFEFMHIFERFHGTLGKVCFFGDPRQLPPYGKDIVRSIETIFDIKHILNSRNNFFLDTQYRMPVQIGNFISVHVYGKRLKSAHTIKHNKCVAFINVPPFRGGEIKAGFSWRNDGEIQTLVHIVKIYYRYRKFCIVTPYDGQRAAIQRALETENLPSDSVYNLDSFQGNEADYILISVVRSDKPGFLVSQNRMNVLLTRCKKAMVIVSSRSFIQSGGSNTLLGCLANYWSRLSGMETNIWTNWNLVADGIADLPDAFGPHRSKQLTPSPETVVQPLHPSHHRILFNKNQPAWGSVRMNLPTAANPQQSPKFHCAEQETPINRVTGPKFCDEGSFPLLQSQTKSFAAIAGGAVTAIPDKHSFLLKRPVVHRNQEVVPVRSAMKLPKNENVMSNESVVSSRRSQVAAPPTNKLKISLTSIGHQSRSKGNRRW